MILLVLNFCDCYNPLQLLGLQQAVQSSGDQTILIVFMVAAKTGLRLTSIQSPFVFGNNQQLAFAVT